MAALRSCGVLLALLLVIGQNASAREPRTEQFDQAPLHHSWTFFAPAGGSYEIRDGWLHLTAPGPFTVLDGDRTSMPPMLLIDPPVGDVFSFETRVRFHQVTPLASAGIIAIGKDLHSRMILAYNPGPRVPKVTLAWRAGLPLAGGGATPVGQLADIWLRAELPSDMPAVTPKFFLKEGGEEEPWIPAMATRVRPFFLPRIIAPRFMPGEYWIGLFVDGGSDEGDEVEAAFDYFHSPQLRPLAVQAGNTATTLWASLKHRRRPAE